MNKKLVIGLVIVIIAVIVVIVALSRSTTPQPTTEQEKTDSQAISEGALEGLSDVEPLPEEDLSLLDEDAAAYEEALFNELEE